MDKDRKAKVGYIIFLILLFQLYAHACESSSLYQQHGSGDAGAGVLDKTAKIIEERAPELAVKLYQQAAEVSSVRIL